MNFSCVLSHVPLSFSTKMGKMKAVSSVLLKNKNLLRPLSNNSLGYEPKKDESIEVKRARLLYQSRKRGMLENDLILSTFADKYLFTLDNHLLTEYDKLINSDFSDWDIYYWAIGARSVPEEFNNKLMTLLQEHAQNKDREQRVRQPDLPIREWNK